MARGDKSKYTDKQKRKAQHIEEGYEARGVSEREAEKRAWATVNKQDHGGKKGGRQHRGSVAVSAVVLALIVLGIGALIVMTGRSRARFEDASVAAQAASTTASLATTSALAKSAAKPAVKSTATAKPAAAPTPKAYSYSSSTVVVGTNAPLCTANDLTGMAHLQGASGSVAGTVSVTNSSKRPCMFSHDVRLQLLSGNTALNIIQTANYSSGTLSDMMPGDTVDLGFVWGNWCRSALSSAASVRVMLASGEGYLKVPFIAADGRAQSDSPSCVASSTQSYIYIL